MSYDFPSIPGLVPATTSATSNPASAAGSPPSLPAKAAADVRTSPGAAAAHSCHAFVRDPRSPLVCAFPGCELLAESHTISAGRAMREAIAAGAKRVSALIPDNWIDAKATGDRRYEPSDACTFCRAKRNHSPAVHLEEIELAESGS